MAHHHLHRSFFISGFHIAVFPDAFHHFMYPIIPLHHHPTSTHYNNNNDYFAYVYQVSADETLIIDAVASTGQRRPPQMGADDETLILHAAGPRADDPGRHLSQHEVLKYIKVGRADNNLQDSDICVICQDALLCQENVMIRSLNCGHEYHVACISQWLQQKTTCPLCNRVALPIIAQ